MRTSKFKSKFEKEFYDRFKLDYEVDTFPYTLTKKYTPDWKYSDTIYFETKGLLDAEAKQKAFAMKEQHPHLRIIFVFQNANKKIYKGSSTTYGEWCVKNGFEFFDWNSIKHLTKAEELLSETKHNC